MALDPKIYAFGEFRLDSAKRRLCRAGVEVRLEGRVLDLLMVLIEHRGQTLSRSELMQALWGPVSVSDGSLRRTVSLLRKAIDARGPAATAVETVHGKGYRFAGSVRSLEADAGAPAPREEAPREEAPKPHSPAAQPAHYVRLEAAVV